MGRPAELNPELAERIVGYLRDGASLKDASRACGYHESTVRLWRRKGEQPRAREPYVSFCAALTRARREGKLALVAQIRTAAQHDWRAAA